MRVIRADVLGMCFGVRDALKRAAQVERPEEVTIHGQLVHNADVVRGLEARGFRLADEVGRDVPATPLVMITAHGVSDAERARLRAAGKGLIDTTCPLVARVHRAARELAEAGYFVVVVGRRGHVEVRGIVGDLDEFVVVESAAEVVRYPQRRIGIVSQSTAVEATVESVHAAVIERNPGAEIRQVDTICAPTRDHQRALARLLDEVEAVVVVGGRHSNNSKELVATAGRRGLPAVLVEGPDDLDPVWLAGFEIVGLTAGTSTPDPIIDAVERAIGDCGLRIADRGFVGCH